MMKLLTMPRIRYRLMGLTLLVVAGLTSSPTFAQNECGVPSDVSAVTSMVANTTATHPTVSWIGAWTGVTATSAGFRSCFVDLRDNPNTPEVEEQVFFCNPLVVGQGILALGPNNQSNSPEMTITVTTDSGVIEVYMPAFTSSACTFTRFYVAADGSTYHSRADHNYIWSQDRVNYPGGSCFGQGSMGPDLTPEQALVPEHLARSAPACSTLSHSPEELLEDLIVDVAEINLTNGISNALDNKLDAAVDAFLAENADQRHDAVNKMQSFKNYVEAQRGKKISDAESDYLISAADNIIQVIDPQE